MLIIPMVHVNGSDGIGIGWSSYIANYSPRDIVGNVRHLLNGEPMEVMDPWYKGFSSTIEKTATKESGDYIEHNDDTTVQYGVFLSGENMTVAKQDGLLKKFKFTTTINTTNMKILLRERQEASYNSEVVAGSIGVRASDYEYLLSMVIGTLTLEKVQDLCAGRDKLRGEVDELSKATPKSLWIKDLDALERELDEQDKTSVQAEAARNEMKSRVMGEAGVKRLQNPKVRGGPNKAPAREAMLDLRDEDDDEVLELKHRLAAYNLKSSPHHSERNSNFQA
ncbi:hypothetical protein RHMOL_Rhmol11G0203500 [Rhododendron molle]|uniref:Uncharacterized protein n=1 Tax=Rhododendron molle TaxID=49168 RepID=A0ACC0LUH7_RHOML|nr:hypothetical protein RHMOL_Rhmol11G0203500 [Rhododendron molle]